MKWPWVGFTDHCSLISSFLRCCITKVAHMRENPSDVCGFTFVVAQRSTIPAWWNACSHQTELSLGGGRISLLYLSQVDPEFWNHRWTVASGFDKRIMGTSFNVFSFLNIFSHYLVFPFPHSERQELFSSSLFLLLKYFLFSLLSVRQSVSVRFQFISVERTTAFLFPREDLLLLSLGNPHACHCGSWIKDFSILCSHQPFCMFINPHRCQRKPSWACWYFLAVFITL